MRTLTDINAEPSQLRQIAMSYTRTEFSRQSLRWAWILLPPVVITTTFFAIFGPYLRNETLVRRLEKQGVRFNYFPVKKPVPLWSQYIRSVPGFQNFGIPLMEAEVDLARLKNPEPTSVIDDLVRLGVPVRADLSPSKDLDGDLKSLQKVPVFWLTIVDRTISPAAANSMRQQTGLNVLTLSGCHFDRQTIEELSHLERLEFLDLHQSSITDETITPLTKLKSLTNISLSNTHVSDAAKEELQKALPRTSITDD